MKNYVNRKFIYLFSIWFILFGQISSNAFGNNEQLSPVRLGYFSECRDAMGLHVINNTAYVADAEGGLKIIDVSNPFHPEELGN